MQSRCCSEWGLHGNSVTIFPVSSYLTFPHLPRMRRLFSVALSLESPPPVVSRHSCSAEPGLSSRAFCARDRLTYSYNIILYFFAFVKSIPQKTAYGKKNCRACDGKNVNSADRVFTSRNLYTVGDCAHRNG